MARKSKKQPKFDTGRLSLRPYRESDLKALHVLYADAENLRYWSTLANTDVEQTRKALRWHIAYSPAHYAMWAVEEKKSGRLIGMINYHRRDRRERRVDVGWLILPKFQGKGLMTEAARALLRYLIDDLKVHKVEALIRADNKPSAALAKRLGFRLEGGPIRDRWLVGNRWHSVMLYGLIAGEER
ncbi:MAG: GNAT family N-acetyltransferase [Reyranellales bacterium]